MARVSDDRARWLAKHVLPHEPWLRSWLERNNSLGYDVDDIVQEAYARIILLDDVGHIRNARNYLAQTSRSIVLQQIRRSRVVTIDAIGSMDDLDIADDHPAPDREAEAREELRLVAAAIATLPRRCREVFVLRKVDGRSIRETAGRLGYRKALSKSTLATPSAS